MPKKKYRPPRTPKIEYVHEHNAKEVLKKAVAKYGTLRQVALNIGCCVAHIYRFNDSSCRMSRLWFEKLQLSLSSSQQSLVEPKTRSKVSKAKKVIKGKRAKVVGTDKTVGKCK